MIKPHEYTAVTTTPPTADESTSLDYMELEVNELQASQNVLYNMLHPSISFFGIFKFNFPLKEFSDEVSGSADEVV